MTGRAATASRLVRLALRTLYRLGYPLARAWWWAVPQLADGVALAVVAHGRVLVVRQSFRRGLGLPGGGLRAGGEPAAEAARELREETGLAVDAARLESCGVLALRHECRQLRVHLFSQDLDHVPTLQPDGAEVVSAEWIEPARLRGRPDLHPVLALWLARGVQ
jgi:8-oxo-dGTP pyrophosphatase MutT (NUDIX family)